MPKLSKHLVMSLITDIKECVHVANEIYSWLGDIEHLSWKFPTKTAKDINTMEVVKEHSGTAGEFYILLLELAYDRLFSPFFRTRLHKFVETGNKAFSLLQNVRSLRRVRRTKFHRDFVSPVNLFPKIQLGVRTSRDQGLRQRKLEPRPVRRNVFKRSVRFADYRGGFQLDDSFLSV